MKRDYLYQIFERSLKGEYILVIDYFSRYYEIKIIHQANAAETWEALDNIFATHGLAITINTITALNLELLCLRHFVMTEQ